MKTAGAALVAAAALSLALSACHPSTPTTASTDGPSTPIVAGSTPDPTTPTTPPAPPALSGSKPAARTSAGCGDLASNSVLHPLFTETVSPADPSRTDEYIGLEVSDSAVVRQDGGLSCWWMSDDATITSEGAYDSQYANVRILPATWTDFAAFSSASASGADHRTNCSYGFCQYDKLTANGWWLSIVANGVPFADDSATTALANPVFAAIASTVAALPAPTTPWTAPTPDLAVPASCTGVISGADLNAALGLSGTSTVDSSWSQPGQYTTAFEHAGGTVCRWDIVGASYGDTVEIDVLPGGEWAQEAAVAAAETLGITVPTPAITGVPAGKTAQFDHVDSSAVDIVIGGTWFKIGRGNGPDIHGLDNGGVLRAIAAKIAALHHV